MTDTAKKFSKGDAVFFNGGQRRGNPVSAEVVTAHRDGTATVRARFSVDAEGRDIPGTFLGFKARTSNANLFVSFSELPR